MLGGERSMFEVAALYFGFSHRTQYLKNRKKAKQGGDSLSIFGNFPIR